MKKIAILLVGGVLSMTSCTSEDSPHFESEPAVSEETSTLRAAISIAERMMDDVQEGPTRSSKRTVRSIECVINPHKTRGQEDDIYVVNYDGEGFAIVSTDPARTPVCAFSPSGTLSVSDTASNPALKEYMDLLVGGIINPMDTTMQWIDPNPGWTPIPPVQGAYGEVVLAPILPVSVANWNQTPPYNALCPTIDGKRCVTGCLPLACAMLMSHYEWPEQYGNVGFNWTNMKTSSYASDLHYLLTSLGDKDNLHATYGLQETGAHLSNAPRTFERFGYKKPSIASFHSLLSDMGYDTPVLVTGTYHDGDKKRGHAWIIDGTYLYHYGDLGYVPGLVQSYHHTVWGWGGVSNGYFMYGDSVAYAPKYVEKYESVRRINRTYGGFEGIGKLTKR